ncbi:nuclear transport factor 2 family protein [Thermomonospora cellulosilytica]|uniref:Ketosteroid isomerase-like protein n=1 Tax=Thermomonospora cellulosilytica TaxID=1411118 RepID=A0A7W3R8Z0_9ACTN|nr:nuclear transport factor 2 family protein [Thermomonospora cellulosilytica]MBA9004187.1 ketosteroid isomerase-like protein [Thermomonospora cellulosilytica]
MSRIVWEAPDGDHPARRAARSSMAAVVDGRRDDWLALFAPDAVVEDPVGPSMLDPEGRGHRGTDEIRRFWDRHIASVDAYWFHVWDSFANGPCCANVVTITTAMDRGTTMTIDCVIVYTVDDDGLITSLRAHWEPDRAMATLSSPARSTH